jgi:hypothetical protein
MYSPDSGMQGSNSFFFFKIIYWNSFLYSFTPTYMTTTKCDKNLTSQQSRFPWHLVVVMYVGVKLYKKKDLYIPAVYFEK